MAAAVGKSVDSSTSVIDADLAQTEEVPKVIVLLDKACLETVKTKKVSFCLLLTALNARIPALNLIFVYLVKLSAGF